MPVTGFFPNGHHIWPHASDPCSCPNPPPPLPSNTSPSSFTPLNSPDRSRCSRVVLFRQKHRTKHPRTLFLQKAKGVRGVRGRVLAKPNPSTGQSDGLLGSFMSIWTHQNCRKYPLEGLLGCVLSSGKQENPRNSRVECHVPVLLFGRVQYHW